MTDRGTEAPLILFPLNVVLLEKVRRDDFERKLDELIREIEGGGDDAA